MQVTDDIIRHKSIDMYDNTIDLELIDSVKEYNQIAEKMIVKLRTSKRIHTGMILMNLFSIYTMLIQWNLNVLYRSEFVALYVIITVLFLISIPVFLIWKKYLWVHTIFSALLPILSTAFVLYPLGNFLLSYLYWKSMKPCMETRGYPEFSQITIRFLSGNAPTVQNARDESLRGGTGMLIVDRIEEDTIVLECSNPASGEVYEQNIPRTWVLGDVHEGDVLCKTAEGYAVNEAETRKRRLNNALRLQSLDGEK